MRYVNWLDSFASAGLSHSGLSMSRPGGHPAAKVFRAPALLNATFRSEGLADIQELVACGFDPGE